jgi:hypothetical protein
MADYTERFTETAALLYNLAPISVSNGVAVYTSYVSLANYHRAVVVIHTGVMASNSTLDAVIHQATDTSGTSTKVLTATKAITQLTQAGGDSNKDVAIEVRTEELDVANGFDCIALQYTVGTAATLLSIEIYGLVPRFAPVATTAWDEIVD